MSVPANAHLRLLDRPCGSGKTTEMIKSFKPDQRYLVVVQLRSEIERIIEEAAIVFEQPEETKTYRTLKAHLRALLQEKKSVVTTHALYNEIQGFVREGLLDDYIIIIDEVPDVLRTISGASKRSLEALYVGAGYVDIASDGRITPTPKWDEEVEQVADTLKPQLYHLANSGMLYRVDGKFIVWSYPTELLTAGLSVTIMTYLAKGSLLYHYLKKQDIAFVHDEDVAAVAKARQQARDLVEVRPIRRLWEQKFSYTAQGECVGGGGSKPVASKAACDVAATLRDLKRGPLAEVPLDELLIVCRKDCWYLHGDDHPNTRKQGPFAKGTKMFKGVTWLPNTTRGTNDYAHATHMIYLYDQYVHPVYLRFLGVEDTKAFSEQYALAELVQVIYRTAVRRGEKVVVYIPSERMRKVFEDYRNSDLEVLPLAA